MRTEDGSPVLAVALAAALVATLTLGGCAGSGKAPPGWLPTAETVGNDVYGGWLTLKPVDRQVRLPEGELLAASPDSVWVLPPGGEVVAVPWTQVRRARVEIYDPQLDRPFGWGLLGGLAAASNGVWWLVSLPVWVIGGSVSTHAHAEAARLEYPEHAWSVLRAGARFPAGLPPGLPRRFLPGRPWAAETAAPATRTGADSVPD